jgi:hypothetical protein
MVDFITTDMDKPFSMFGESDEKDRIKGGSSALIKVLVDALQDRIEMKQGWALTSLDYKDKKIVMGFDAPGGPQTQSFDAVILALPFTKLRQVTYTLGSYASCKVGQYTTMLDVAAEPALGGRLQFAGEHTSGDFLGFMNGGVQSGNRAAAALAKLERRARSCLPVALSPVLD